jgi:5-methylcytosine-specific restriction endonuclease McrA
MSQLDEFCKRLLNAKPSDEPSRAKLNWGNRVKLRKKLKRGHTQVGRTSYHPGTKDARTILRMAGRNLKTCQRCNSTYKVAVHHRDRNPYNNRLENLDILCADCHAKEHRDLDENDIPNDSCE